MLCWQQVWLAIVDEFGMLQFLDSFGHGEEMPTFRGTNFRSGDLAEATAMLLLQQVALVAPVPRTEDVGIDAIVTLHREFDQHRLIAEDSLFVQIKSASVSCVEYAEQEVRWLYELDLPLFYASFDMENCRISLFCAQQMAEAFITNHDRKKLLVYFDGEPDCLDIVDAKNDEVHLGPPIMVWDMNQCSKDRKALRANFHAVVKGHVLVQKANLAYRSVGRVENYSWKTNEVPPRAMWKTISTKQPGEILNAAYEKMIPFFCIWALELQLAGDWHQAYDVMKLLEGVRKTCELRSAREAVPVSTETASLPPSEMKP